MPVCVCVCVTPPDLDSPRRGDGRNRNSTRRLQWRASWWTGPVEWSYLHTPHSWSPRSPVCFQIWCKKVSMDTKKMDFACSLAFCQWHWCHEGQWRATEGLRSWGTECVCMATNNATAENTTAKTVFKKCNNWRGKTTVEMIRSENCIFLEGRDVKLKLPVAFFRNTHRTLNAKNSGVLFLPSFSFIFMAYMWTTVLSKYNYKCYKHCITTTETTFGFTSLNRVTCIQNYQIPSIG